MRRFQIFTDLVCILKHSHNSCLSDTLITAFKVRCVNVYNYIISFNIIVYFWCSKTNNNISVLCGLVQCFYLECFTYVQYSRLDSSGQNLESNGVWPKNKTESLECLCWFINKFLITTVRAITFWILDDVNDAFHFEETYLLPLIFESQRFWSRTQLHSVKTCEIKGKEWLNTLSFVG